MPHPPPQVSLHHRQIDRRGFVARIGRGRRGARQRAPVHRQPRRRAARMPRPDTCDPPISTAARSCQRADRGRPGGRPAPVRCAQSPTPPSTIRRAHLGRRQLTAPAHDRALCTGRLPTMRRAVGFAARTTCAAAVRGGGRSTSGKSSCDGGLMLDLAPMQGVRVDTRGAAPSSEPGTLARAARPRDHGLRPHHDHGHGVAHRCRGTPPLGGSFGRISRRFGLACDSLVGADLVTADCQRVRPASENPTCCGACAAVAATSAWSRRSVPPASDEPDDLGRRDRLARGTRATGAAPRSPAVADRADELVPRSGCW